MKICEMDEAYWAISQIRQHLSLANELLKSEFRPSEYVQEVIEYLKMDKFYACGLIADTHLQEFYIAECSRLLIQLENL